MDLLEAVQARARVRLARDLSTLRAELTDAGAAGELVRARPFLSLLGAAVAGVGAGLAARVALRSSARLVGLLARLPLVPVLRSLRPGLVRRLVAAAART